MFRNWNDYRVFPLGREVGVKEGVVEYIDHEVFDSVVGVNDECMWDLVMARGRERISGVKGCVKFSPGDCSVENGVGVEPIRDESLRGVGMSDSFDGRGDS